LLLLKSLQAIQDLFLLACTEAVSHACPGAVKKLACYRTYATLYLTLEDLLSQLLEAVLKPCKLNRWPTPTATLTTTNGGPFASLSVGRVMPPAVGLWWFYGYRTWRVIPLCAWTSVH